MMHLTVPCMYSEIQTKAFLKLISCVIPANVLRAWHIYQRHYAA